MWIADGFTNTCNWQGTEQNNYGGFDQCTEIDPRVLKLLLQGVDIQRYMYMYFFIACMAGFYGMKGCIMSVSCLLWAIITLY